MCGIVGITGERSADWIQVMNDAQRHRGPDDEGLFHGAGISLGQRRLYSGFDGWASAYVLFRWTLYLGL